MSDYFKIIKERRIPVCCSEPSFSAGSYYIKSNDKKYYLISQIENRISHTSIISILHGFYWEEKENNYFWMNKVLN